MTRKEKKDEQNVIWVGEAMMLDKNGGKKITFLDFVPSNPLLVLFSILSHKRRAIAG